MPRIWPLPDDSSGSSYSRARPGIFLPLKKPALPRSNLFFVYNSVENQLQAPFCGNKPRPDFLSNRSHTEALKLAGQDTWRKTG